MSSKYLKMKLMEILLQLLKYISGVQNQLFKTRRSVYTIKIRYKLLLQGHNSETIKKL